MANRGRPRSPLTVRVMVRISEEDLAEFSSHAERAGLSLSSWLRMAAKKAVSHG